MSERHDLPMGGLKSQRAERQKCFIGHSLQAPWREDLVAACREVLPAFGLEPWYAADHFTPSRPLREKVVDLIANTSYASYDLSCWRQDERSAWNMPCNVFIELGIALALNRPILLLRHTSNHHARLPLPACLEGIANQILPFSGGPTLCRILKDHLERWVTTQPEQDWWNRYCTFGGRICPYRETYPHKQWEQPILHCHISDGNDPDRLDFREIVEEVLGRFDDVSFDYLDALPIVQGYDFLLCSCCQKVRSTPFVIYRITPFTPPETFIAIGISLALETQFSQSIPKMLLTSDLHDIPSLLMGYDVVEAHNDYERKMKLSKFVPQVIQQARKTSWKARPLPFIEVLPRPTPQEEEPSPDEFPEDDEPLSEPENLSSGPLERRTLLHKRYLMQRTIGQGADR